jgi:serine/threonine protein phosphatase 1
MLQWLPSPVTLPPDERVYAIGDIHGCASRLRDLHGAIARDMKDRPTGRAVLVHAGDYVDRGPDSASVIDMLAAGPTPAGLPAVNLMGNHEQMMLEALAGDDAEAAVLWLRNGGSESLKSWGVPRRVRQSAWASHLPAAHISFLSGLAVRHREGPYLFVHAGIRPGVPLDEQSPRDLLWIREPFLSSHDDFGVVVVHGHTPTEEPVVRANRIGIDTGAVLGGRLTCAVLEGDQIGLMSA